MASTSSKPHCKPCADARLLTPYTTTSHHGRQPRCELPLQDGTTCQILIGEAHKLTRPLSTSGVLLAQTTGMTRLNLRLPSGASSLERGLCFRAKISNAAQGSKRCDVTADLIQAGGFYVGWTPERLLGFYWLLQAKQARMQANACKLGTCFSMILRGLPTDHQRGSFPYFCTAVQGNNKRQLSCQGTLAPLSLCPAGQVGYPDTAHTQRRVLE